VVEKVPQLGIGRRCFVLPDGIQQGGMRMTHVGDQVAQHFEHAYILWLRESIRHHGPGTDEAGISLENRPARLARVKYWTKKS
jgi:hypothetical protein